VSTTPSFREAPAAKHYHQAYAGGLLEHSLSVAQAVSAAANFFPGIDREIAVTGAMLHDIGKTEAYNDDPLAIELTDAGRLEGEIPRGYYRVRREIEAIEGFDPDLAQGILHIILSHHGQLEHGSPVAWSASWRMVRVGPASTAGSTALPFSARAPRSHSSSVTQIA
jgi:3'-5' exoribonuclease